MTTDYDYLDSASFIGSKKDLQDYLASCPDLDGMEVVHLSARRYALFTGLSCVLVPAHEKPQDAASWVKNPKRYY